MTHMLAYCLKIINKASVILAARDDQKCVLIAVSAFAEHIVIDLLPGSFIQHTCHEGFAGVLLEMQ